MFFARSYLGQVVTVHVDRPLGSHHPEHGHLYPVNYGYLPGVPAADREPLDAYVLGVDVPLKAFTGCCVAIIHRFDDDDDKLIVVPPGTALSDDEIRAATHFQEQYFHSVIWR